MASINDSISISINSFNRFDINTIEDPGCIKNGKRIQGINGYQGIIGWILENIFHKAVAIKGQDGIYYLNCKSFTNWFLRVDPKQNKDFHYHSNLNRGSHNPDWIILALGNLKRSLPSSIVAGGNADSNIQTLPAGENRNVNEPARNQVQQQSNLQSSAQQVREEPRVITVSNNRGNFISGNSGSIGNVVYQEGPSSADSVSNQRGNFIFGNSGSIGNVVYQEGPSSIDSVSDQRGNFIFCSGDNSIGINYGNVVFQNDLSINKSEYGHEVLSSIDSIGNINLTGTTVNGPVTVTSIKGRNVRLQTVNASSKISLSNSTCTQKINAGGSIDVDNCTLESANAGGSIHANQCRVQSTLNAGVGSVRAHVCPKLGGVNAGGKVYVSDCPSVHSISVGGKLSLTNSTVHGDVAFGGRASIHKSTIRGNLSFSSDYVTIDASNIDTIRVKSLNNFTVVGENGGIIINRGNIGFIHGNVYIDGQLQTPQQNHQNTREQIIELRHGCHVKNIIFEGGRGKVLLKEGSRVNSITGGELQHS